MGFGSSSQKSNTNSQQTSASTNQAFPALQGSLMPQVSQSADGANAVRSLLGLDGSGAQDAGFQKFKDSSGYDFIQKQGIDGITSSNAAKGLLGSGSTLKSISGYSSGLASNFLNSYLSNLMGLSNNGLQAAGVLAGAGGTSNSQGTSTGVSTGKSMNFTTG